MPFDTEDATNLRSASSDIDTLLFHCSTRRERLTLAILSGLVARSPGIEAVTLYDVAREYADQIVNARKEP